MDMVNIPAKHLHVSIVISNFYVSMLTLAIAQLYSHTAVSVAVLLLDKSYVVD